LIKGKKTCCMSDTFILYADNGLTNQVYLNKIVVDINEYRKIERVHE